ncbi:MAG TPA: hypothetical protein VGJ25_05195 [Gaiellaceae bacterium]
MKRLAVPLGLAVLATVGLTAAIVSGAPRELTVQAWLLALGALGLATGALALRAPRRASQLEHALRRRPQALERPLQLERLEREVVLGAGSAFDLHYRLRNTLREIAAQRLAERHALDLDADGPDVLTADTWAVLRPDREAPRDRHAAGIPLGRLSRLLDELEAL